MTPTLRACARAARALAEFAALATLAALALAGCGGDDGPASPGDTEAPAAIADLAVQSVTDSSVALAWTAPGDDGATGTAASYEIRYATAPITASTWDACTPVAGEPAPAAAGTAQGHTVAGLADTTVYYFAIRASDDASNVAALSNVASAATLAEPSPYGEEDYETLAALIESVLAAIGPAVGSVSGLGAAEGIGGGLGKAPGDPDVPDNRSLPVGECPVIVATGGLDSVEVTLDYGTGCTGADGVYRSGSLVLSGDYAPLTGWDLAVRFNSYVVDSGLYAIDGTYRLTGRLSGLTCEVASRVSTGGTDYDVDMTLTMAVDLDTSDIWSTTVVIGGSGEVAVSSGGRFTFAIPDEDQILWAADCAYPEDGSIVLTIPQEDLELLGMTVQQEDVVASVDFAAPNDAAPTCDGVVRISIDGYSEEMDLSE